MPDTQYKRRNLSHKTAHTPSGYNVRGGAPLEQHWFGNALKAQDTICETARRVVVSQHMGGQAQEWSVPDGDPDGQGSQTHPEPDELREILHAEFELAPGCMLEARSLYLPSGATQEFGGSYWDFEGNLGITHFALEWDNAANTDSTTHEIVQEPSILQYGKQDPDDVWPTIRYGYLPNVVPSNDWLENAIATKWSEWTTVNCVVSHKGSPRTIHATLTEAPRVYVDAHDNDGEASAHCYPPAEPLKHPDTKPQVDSVDGATYEEHRFGTERLLDVARRQGDRMGPRIFHWSPHVEGQGGAGVGGNPADPNDLAPDPASTTSASYRCLWDSTITSWTAAAPGFAMPAAYALRYKENNEVILPGGAEAVIPCRVRAWARVAGGGTGYIQTQVSASSINIKSITGASYAMHEWTCFLESSRAGDDGVPNAMVFYASDGVNATDVLYYDLTFGDFAVSG